MIGKSQGGGGVLSSEYLQSPDSEVGVPKFVRSRELFESPFVNHVDHGGLGVATGIDVPEP